MVKDIKSFIARVQDIQKRYADTGDLRELENALLALSDLVGAYSWSADALLTISQQYMEMGDQPAGFAFVRAVDACFPNGNNSTVLYLRMAQYYFEIGDSEKGIPYLLKLCTDTVSNYEESIAFNGLEEIWLRYKPIVAGKVPESVRFQTANPKSPAECTMTADEIFSLPQADILSALSDHLGELSADGVYLQNLNKWEKTAYYADRLCMEVNSGGFGSYLYYYGRQFEKAYNAFQAICADQMLKLMDAVRGKFPKRRIPLCADTLQDTLDAMEENGIDFDDEDSVFYEIGEKELLERLLSYVLHYRDHFR